jgi:hypothetical protein
MKSAPAEQSSDEPLSALAHIQRRKLLLALLSHNLQDGPVIIDGEELGNEVLKRLLEMEYVHFTKQERDGFIDWNQDSNQVSKRPDFEAIRPLETLVTSEDEQ